MMRRLFFLLTAALAGCGDLETNNERQREERAAAPARTASKSTCASTATYERLKELAFDEAVRVRKAGSPLLDQLAASSVVRMEDPVVKSRDEALDVTVCSGRLILELPPGISDAFDGERRLVANVEYAAQAASDGSGMVFRMDGAEPIIYRLAAVALNDRPRMARVEPPAPAPAASEVEIVQPLPPTYRPAPPPPALVARPAPVPRPVVVARPSFNCRNARTRSERAVCASPALAARDRAMSARFYDAMGSLDGAGRRALRDSRDRFLAYRDRCRDDACIARAYDDRIDEIADIARDR